MGQIAQNGLLRRWPGVGSRPAPVLFALLALVLSVLTVASVSAVVLGSRIPAAAEPTTVLTATDSTVVSADGLRTWPATRGAVVARGQSVHTGADGTAVLVTAGRRTYLAAQSAYQVLSGVAGTVVTGTVVVDGRHGPAADLGVGTVSVSPRPDTAMRVERGFGVRVGVYAGSAGVRNDAGRTVDVTALHQVLAVGHGMPASATALALVDDALERAVVPQLVADDLQLGHTADALDTTGQGITLVRHAVADGLVPGAVIPAAFTSGTPATTSAPPSEVALPLAIASAAATEHRSGGDVAHRLGEIRTWRSQGGSWAVVVRLAGTDLNATAAAIDRLLAASPGVVLLAAGPPPAAAPAGIAPAPPAATTAATRPPASTGSTTVQRPAPTPTPTPNPVQSITGTATGTVDSLVDTVGTLVGGATGTVGGAVGGLLGSPTPASTTTPGLPVTVP